MFFFFLIIIDNYLIISEETLQFNTIYLKSVEPKVSGSRIYLTINIIYYHKTILSYLHSQKYFGKQFYKITYIQY